VISYRKSKDGQWVAFGPAAEVKVGPVTVTTKDGRTKRETVASLGREFDVSGVAHVYGYLAPKAAPVYVAGRRYGASEGSISRRGAGRRRGGCGYPGCDGTGFCDECSE
jgi:hypothetical protein